MSLHEEPAAADLLATARDVLADPAHGAHVERAALLVGHAAARGAYVRRQRAQLRLEVREEVL